MFLNNNNINNLCLLTLKNCLATGFFLFKIVLRLLRIKWFHRINKFDFEKSWI